MKKIHFVNENHSVWGTSAGFTQGSKGAAREQVRSRIFAAGSPGAASPGRVREVPARAGKVGRTGVGKEKRRMGQEREMFRLCLRFAWGSNPRATLKTCLLKQAPSSVETLFCAGIWHRGRLRYEGCLGLRTKTGFSQVFGWGGRRIECRALPSPGGRKRETTTFTLLPQVRPEIQSPGYVEDVPAEAGTVVGRDAVLCGNLASGAVALRGMPRFEDQDRFQPGFGWGGTGKSLIL